MSQKYVTNEIVKRSSGVIRDSGVALIASINKEEIINAVKNKDKSIEEEINNKSSIKDKETKSSINKSTKQADKDTERSGFVNHKKNVTNIKFENNKKSASDSLNKLLDELSSYVEKNKSLTQHKERDIEKNNTSNTTIAKTTVNKKTSVTKDKKILLYHVIVASFALNDSQNANKYLKTLIKQGYDAHIITSKRHRISIVSCATFKEANKRKKEISNTTKFKDCWVFKYKK